MLNVIFKVNNMWGRGWYTTKKHTRSIKKYRHDGVKVKSLL